MCARVCARASVHTGPCTHVHRLAASASRHGHVSPVYRVNVRSNALLNNVRPYTSEERSPLPETSPGRSNYSACVYTPGPASMCPHTPVCSRVSVCVHGFDLPPFHLVNNCWPSLGSPPRLPDRFPRLRRFLDSTCRPRSSGPRFTGCFQSSHGVVVDALVITHHVCDAPTHLTERITCARVKGT